MIGNMTIVAVRITSYRLLSVFIENKAGRHDFLALNKLKEISYTKRSVLTPALGNGGLK
ncbi:hypothetical protein [Geobacillus thermodenitrificans]|uniref:Transposase n=1 Tax=Geobacillus thermodenitrificans TaxID=33940 RepID=A0ABY9QFD2_GEOTD|nr:hypothetical protein [Geobacillus thermodenitrificans]WMV77620.1 hypothetical protein HSX42_07730 [Geobacillus thermodenitrificans]